MKRIYLIDCPGVVPPSQGDSEQDILLRGVVRVENVEHPAQYIDAVLRRTQTRHIERTYDIKHADYNDDSVEFLSILARKAGRLLKGGEPDVDGVAKMVLNDFLRGKIPWFTPPPKKEKVESAVGTEVVEGRKGTLGEMPAKRKADDLVPQERSEPIGEAAEGLSDEDAESQEKSNVDEDSSNEDEGAELLADDDSIGSDDVDDDNENE